ncbi:MAG: zinc metallopeptidase [Bacteroidetes bacterium]|nr:zinc metallopeptidase [Bacteroidota bacterium]MBK9047229.1 zinc metallopeptidase [Bacteroidota bacterium]MBK9422893.1 zinc metallopeptidase [Bacteroidota bacterium]MBL0073285.1 zinc metallopeptidase [Bacteroidota bacterium]
MIGIYVISIAFMLIGWLVSMQLKRKFKQYSEVTIGTGMSGKEIAERMLHDNGINDVKVLSVEGQLTDHYNPLEKTVNLSHDVYYGRSAASAAVSAHECGHAVQHATAYTWLQMRSALVPVVSFGSKWVQWVLLGGILMVNTFPSLLLIGIVMFGVITLFSFVTLPVEFDASKRAMVWLETNRIANPQELTMSKDALWWAAMTYVVAALSALATLAYYIMVYMGRRD